MNYSECHLISYVILSLNTTVDICTYICIRCLHIDFPVSASLAYHVSQSIIHMHDICLDRRRRPEIARFFPIGRRHIVCVIWLHFLYPLLKRQVRGYIVFVAKYVTGRRKRLRPHKMYIFLISRSTVKAI